MASFLHRVMGATVLDVTTYEEVEADQGAGLQSMAVVLLSALAAGVGGRGFGQSPVSAIPTVALVALLSWAAWALLTYQIGARLMPEPETRVDVGQLLRTLGFASAPGMLRVVGVVPDLAMSAFVLTSLWMLAAMVVAIRQALDYRSTGRAVLVSVLGATLTLAMAAVLSLFFYPVVH
jgi:hypothetical protein